MPTPELAKSLVDIGGAALFLFTIALIAVGLWRQWWVPGWLYRLEREARERADVQAIRNAEALEKLARAVSREPRRGPSREP
jgi:hypothetical protein